MEMESTQQEVKQEGNLNQDPPSSNPISNQKGNFLLIIGIIVVLLVVGAGGYFLYQKQVNKPTVTPQQASYPTPSSTSDETLNWKTYSNSKYGYSFKYPPKLTSVELSPDKGDMVISIIGKSEESNDEGSYTGLFRISSFKPANLMYDSDEIAKELLDANIGETVHPKDRMVGGITRTYGTYRRLPDILIEGLQVKVFEDPKTINGSTVKKFYINKGDSNYLIESAFYSTQAEYYPQELYDQILSTFKFTDQSQINETANWETYKNSKYGFELQHPVNSTVETRTSDGVNPYQYIRIQNYTDQDVMKNNGGLITGQYYLEIFIYDHQLGQKNTETCPESLANPKKVDLGAGVTAYRGNGLGGGDSAAYIYAICANKPNIDYHIQASENFDKVASKIIDSFKFTN